MIDVRDRYGGAPVPLLCRFYFRIMLSDPPNTIQLETFGRVRGIYEISVANLQFDEVGLS